MLIHRPSDQSQDWFALSPKIREEIQQWFAAFEEVPMCKPITTYFTRVGNYIGKSAGTVKRKYYAYQELQDWRVFLPKHKLPKPPTECRTNIKAFRIHLLTLSEQFQRAAKPAIRQLHQDWRNKKIIPGYEDLHGWPAKPAGWSARNLSAIIKAEGSAQTRKSITIGTSSKTNDLLPTVLTTRKGLWAGAVVQIDDMWHDNFVTLGKTTNPVRVIEIGALDLYSGCRTHWGMKPRIKNLTTDKFENLRAGDVRQFVAALFHSEQGYSPRGTMLMAEHGAAALEERVERALYDATGGLIRVERQPIEKSNALLQFYGGSEGGNYRAKAALESSHSLIHNDLSRLALQTGKDPSHRPVTTDRQLQYINRIKKGVVKNCPDVAPLLDLPGLDFHSQFVPFVNAYYRHGLNKRTDHQLEAWQELGFQITEYTTLPGSEQWLSQKQFLELPIESRQIVEKAAQDNPKMWSNIRNLSPAEVFYPAQKNFRFINEAVVADIIGEDLSKELKVNGSFFEFSDLEISPSPLVYEARIWTPDGRYRELPAGDKYQVYPNPFSDRWMMVHGANGTYLGKAELYKRVTSIDSTVFQDQNSWEERRPTTSPDLHEAAAHKHQRIAEQHESLRVRHAEKVTQSQAAKKYNERLVKGEETSTTMRQINATKKAQQTKADNKAIKTTNEIFSNIEITPEAPTPEIQF